MVKKIAEINFSDFNTKVNVLYKKIDTFQESERNKIKAEFQEICDYFDQPLQVKGASAYPGGISQFRDNNAAELFTIGLMLSNQSKLSSKYAKLDAKQRQETVGKLKTFVQQCKIKMAYSQIRNGKKFNKAGVQKRDFKNPATQENAIKKLSGENIQRLVENLKNSKYLTNEYGITKREQDVFKILSDPKNYNLQHATNHFYPILNEGRLNSYTEIQRSNPNYTSAFSTKGNVEKLGNADFVFFRLFFDGINGERTRYGETKLIANVSLLQENGWISLHDQLKPAPTKAPKGQSGSTDIPKYFKWENTVLRKVHAENILNKTQDSALQDGITYHYRTNQFKPGMKSFTKVKKRTISFTEEIFYGPDIIQGIALSVIYELRQLEDSGFRDYFLKLIHDAPLQKTYEHLGSLIKGLFRIEGKQPVAVKLQEKERSEHLLSTPTGNVVQKHPVNMTAVKPEGDGRYNKDLSINPEHMELATLKERLKSVTDKIPVLEKLRGRFKKNKIKEKNYSQKIEKLKKKERRLTRLVAKSELERENIVKYFEKEHNISRKDILAIAWPKLYLIKNNFEQMLEESEEIDFNDLAETPIEFLNYIAENETYYELLSGDLINLNDFSSKYTIEQLKALNEYDLDVAIREKDYKLDELFKLYNKNPLHLECVCASDIGEVISDYAPNVSPIIMKYANELEGDDFDLEDTLKEVTSNLIGRDRVIFKENLKKWFSGNSDFADKIVDLHSNTHFLSKILPNLFPDGDFMGDEPTYLQRLFFPGTVSDEDSDDENNNYSGSDNDISQSSEDGSVESEKSYSSDSDQNSDNEQSDVSLTLFQNSKRKYNTSETEDKPPLKKQKTQAKADALNGSLLTQYNKSSSKKLSETQKLNVFPASDNSSDYLLAWQLQVEEFRKNYHSMTKKKEDTFHLNVSNGNQMSFSLKPTKADGDCFFHAVGKIQTFNREVLVKKLIASSGKKEVLETFALEIRQFLYLGCTGGHPNGAENIACQRLLNSGEFRKLVEELRKAEIPVRDLQVKIRDELGQANTLGKKPEELRDLLLKKRSNLAPEFSRLLKIVSDIDQAILSYCRKKDVFESYVTFYLSQARGFIPFSRDFSGNSTKTTVDIINTLFNMNIQVYMVKNANSSELLTITEQRTERTIPIFHDGIGHFSTLVLNANKHRIPHKIS